MPPVSPRPPISWMKCPDAPGTAGPPFGPPSRGGSDMQLSSSFVPSALAFALAAASTPAGAQSAQADLYIDVATHTMPGMGGLGTPGRFAGNMSGGNASYGMARHRSEEHTSELQSLMPHSYAVLCLTKQKTTSSDQCTHRT